MDRFRALVAGGVCAGLVLVATALPAAAAPPPASPVDRVVIVTANLLEGFSARDLRDMSEMKVFVTRVLDQLPYRPDVLLLQEVASKSARYVANLFERRTGQDYAVIADAGDRAYRQVGDRVILQDTAIVINSETMSKAGRSGYIVTTYFGDDKPEYKKNARALASEDGGTLRLAMASIHVPGPGITKRAKVIATKLDKAYPSQLPEQYEILGGDFNQVGVQFETYGTVKTHPFWDLLTKSFDYVDAIYNVVLGKGVDYVFARGGVWDAGFDKTYDPVKTRGTSAFYSDHRFRWAIVGPDDEAPSVPATVEGRARNTDSPRIKITWAPSTDDAGIAAYDVSRSTDGQSFTKIGATTHLTFYDNDVSRGRTYWYRVVARDYSNNRSAPSEVVEVEA